MKKQTLFVDTGFNGGGMLSAATSQLEVCFCVAFTCSPDAGLSLALCSS